MDQASAGNPSRQVALVRMAERLRDKAREVGNSTLANTSLSELIAAIEVIIERDLVMDLVERDRLN